MRDIKEFFAILAFVAFIGSLIYEGRNHHD